MDADLAKKYDLDPKTAASAPRSSVAGFVYLLAKLHTRRRLAVRAIVSRQYMAELYESLRHTAVCVPKGLYESEGEWLARKALAEDDHRQRMWAEVERTGFAGTLFNIPLYVADQPEDIVFEDAA